MNKTKHGMLLVVAAGAVLVPSAAQAATKQVTIGPAAPLEGVSPETVSDNDFYPGKITIAKGDHVKFKWATGFGDVIYVPKGEAVPSFAAFAGQVSGAKDAAGADMWFNGQPNAVPNMKALVPQGGKVIRGNKTVGSGLSFDGPMKPWKVKFPKAGKYTLKSALHPGKKVTVTVKKSRAGVPSRAQDRKALARQVRKSTKLAQKLFASRGPKGPVVRAGNDDNAIAQFAFFPARKFVKVGDTVTFEMSKRSIETHNVAFGPKAYIGSKPFFGPSGFEPFVVYRSDAPGTAVSFDGTNHGNGYFNTGILDADKRSPMPSRDKVTFTKAGTYAYYCAVHGNAMKGEIVVQ